MTHHMIKTSNHTIQVEEVGIDAQMRTHTANRNNLLDMRLAEYHYHQRQHQQTERTKHIRHKLNTCLQRPGELR